MASKLELLWLNQGPDAGWSWVVAFACSMTTFGTFGVFRCAGVFYAEVIRVMGLTRETASWPFSVSGTVNSLSGIIAAILAHIFSLRAVTVAGCIFSAAGLFLSAFASNANMLILTYGIVHGFGTGLVITCMPIALNAYFKQHKTTANGIFLAGGSLAGLVLPPLVELFIEWYTLTGAFILTSAISVQALIFAFLIRPIDNKSQKSSTRNRIDVEEQSVTIALRGEQSVIESESGISDVLDSSSESRKNYTQIEHEEMHLNSNSITETNSELINKVIQPEKNKFKTVYINCKIVCSNPMFGFVTFSNIVIIFTILTFAMIMVDYGLDKGMDIHEAVLLTSAFAIPEFIGRLCFGWISDKGYITKKSMIFTSQLFTGLFLFLMTVTNNRVLLFGSCALFGLSIGNAHVLINVLLLDYVKQEHLRIAYGIMRSFSAVAFLLRPTFTGLFRDVIGSYDYLIWALTSFNILSGVLWKLEPFMTKTETVLH